MTDPSRASSWYATSFRKLFFDFHSPGAAVGLARDFHAERWADRVAAAGAQAVSAFTKCAFGWSFYRKGSVRYVHPELPDGLDMLEAQVDAFHRRGIRVIGYYHVFNSEPLVRDRPEWRALAPDGTPRDNLMCVQGPLFQEWMLPHLEEIVSSYDVDSMFFDGSYAHSPCHCESCKRRFADEVGGELPASPESGSWREYVSWMLDDYRRIRARIAEVIHGCRPEVIISHNWVYTMRMPEVVPDHVGALMIDIVPDDQVLNGSYQARHWATTGVPFDIMNSAFLAWWGDWTCKPAVAMQHEAAAALANGGLTWLGFQMTHTFDVQPAVMSELARTMEFVRDREPLLASAEPRAVVAILHSTDSHFTHTPSLMVDEATMRGAHKLFLESGLPHHFLDEARLEAAVTGPAARRPSVVVVADQRRIGDGLALALVRYVEEGGGLLVTAKSDTLSDDYQPVGCSPLWTLLGLDLLGESDQAHCYIDIADPDLAAAAPRMPHLADGHAAFVEPIADDVEILAGLTGIYLRSDGKFLLRWSPPGEPTGHPAVTLRRVGRGVAGYIAVEVFRAYRARNVWPLKHLVADLVTRLAPDLPVRVAAPAWLEVAWAEQGDRTIIHLVNHHGNRSVDGNYLCIEQTLPVRDVVVSLRRDRRPTSVTLEPEGTTPTWHYANGLVVVQVPEVCIHAAVVIA